MHASLKTTDWKSETAERKAADSVVIVGTFRQNLIEISRTEMVNHPELENLDSENMIEINGF